MTSSPGDVLDLDITGIAHGGTFVARHEGRVVFVADAIPGERVRARITTPGHGPGPDTAATASAARARSASSSFWRAVTLDVIEASPHRRDHVWPEADVSRAPEDRVGGADLGHIALRHQRTLKRRVLQEALDKFAGGGLEAPEVRAVDDSDGTGWRTRVSLHVHDGVVGPYAARSHRIIEVGSMPLARPSIDAAARRLSGVRDGRVDLVEPGDGRVRVLPRPAERTGRRSRRPRPEVVVERVGDREFQLDAGGFWQVHPLAATVLHAAVSDAVSGRIDPDATHLDLYGGVGLFASALGEGGATDIVTVESDRRATLHAERNLARWDARAVTARVDRFLAALPQGTRTGAVVLDPPRSGAGRAVVESLVSLDPDMIVYVACDPVALARDLGTFRRHDWHAASLTAFDLFPHSHHFEAVALLTR